MMKQIYYAEPSYGRLRRKNGYLIDKTKYIAELERINNPIYLRPRRFGKSFMCSLLEHYYDLRFKNKFDALFGDTWIGQNPTGQQNQYMVLSLNFSTINPNDSISVIEKEFHKHCNRRLRLVRERYTALYEDIPPIDNKDTASNNLHMLTTEIETWDLPPLFVTIDEYDNFANQLIVNYQDNVYEKLTGKNSFFKTFFKVLKAGRETEAIENVYITGILPMTIDDLASAFNVGTFLTLDPTFEAMAGFTQEEVDTLLDDIFEDHSLPATIRDEIDELIKTNYNGYHFVEFTEREKSTPVYNTTILMHFLRHLTEHRKVPTHLTDKNLKTDIDWVRRLATVEPKETKAFVDRLILQKQTPYNNLVLTDQFNIAQFFEKQFFPVSFFYLGLLTRLDPFYLTFPNLNMYEIFVEYFNEMHHLSTENNYAEAMEAFVRHPDLEALFQCYWDVYITQLPEQIFAQVNENFYRTTFYAICTQYLSQWFIWHVERSYPKGKSDLEFVGKHHEKFAGMHWVIEFKYYSKEKMRKEKVNLQTFEAKNEDLDQLRGYVEGLTAKYPEAQASQFVIYCFANAGFRVFVVD
ncbi:MAG: AAA family ATPase [Chloroflexota bacterium]